MREEFLKKIDKTIAYTNLLCYNIYVEKNKYFLIKSGGGTGPVKPDNLQKCKVLNPDR